MKKITFTIVAIFVFIGILYYTWQKTSGNKEELIACTMEAKICPDGSAVGRTGPNCEFAICPEESASTTKTVSDKTLGIDYSYIDNFYINNELTSYVHPVEWPPRLEAESTKFTCLETGGKIVENSKTELKTINGNKYCITTQAEGAAGSTYTTHTYKRQFVNKSIVVSFITRVPQCANYDEPKMSECRAEIENFSIDNTIDKIFSSITLTN